MAQRKGPGPSVKDDEVYEKLRDEGNSKEKSARIANGMANSSREQVSKKGGRSGSYDDWTRAQLYDRAKEIGVPGRSKMAKNQLIDALRDN